MASGLERAPRKPPTTTSAPPQTTNHLCPHTCSTLRPPPGTPTRIANLRTHSSGEPKSPALIVPANPSHLCTPATNYTPTRHSSNHLHTRDRERDEEKEADLIFPVTKKSDLVCPSRRNQISFVHLEGCRSPFQANPSHIRSHFYDETVANPSLLHSHFLANSATSALRRIQVTYAPDEPFPPAHYIATPTPSYLLITSPPNPKPKP